MLLGNLAEVPFELETVIAVRMIAGGRALGLAGGQHNQTLVPITRDDSSGLVAPDLLEDLAGRGVALVPFLEVALGLGPVGGALRLGRSPYAGIREQVADLAEWPLLERLDGALRIRVGQHVLAYQQVIVSREYRQPGSVVLKCGSNFSLVHCRLWLVVDALARARDPGFRCPLAGHGGDVDRGAPSSSPSTTVNLARL